MLPVTSKEWVGEQVQSRERARLDRQSSEYTEFRRQSSGSVELTSHSIILSFESLANSNGEGWPSILYTNSSASFSSPFMMSSLCVTDFEQDCYSSQSD